MILLFCQVFLPEVAALLNKLGFSIGVFAKDITDFFFNIIRQTMDLRKTEQDQVKSIKQIDKYKGYIFQTL